MDKYYKFTSETTPPIRFCGWLRDGETILTNPPAELIMAHGFKPLIEEEMPSDAGYIYSPVWYHTDENITCSWVVSEITDEISDSEALSIITGGEEE